MTGLELGLGLELADGLSEGSVDGLIDGLGDADAEELGELSTLGDGVALGLSEDTAPVSP